MRFLTEMVQKKVEFPGKDDNMFHLEGRNTLLKAISLWLRTEYTETCNKEMMKKELGYCNCGHLWDENSNGNVELLVYFIQFF